MSRGRLHVDLTSGNATYGFGLCETNSISLSSVSDPSALGIVSLCNIEYNMRCGIVMDA